MDARIGIWDNMVDVAPVEFLDSQKPYILEAMQRYADHELESAHRWIPIEEELPEVTLSKGDKSGFGHNVTDQILAMTRTDGIKLTKRVFVKGKWIWPANYDVIKWRPLNHFRY